MRSVPALVLLVLVSLAGCLGGGNNGLGDDSIDQSEDPLIRGDEIGGLQHGQWWSYSIDLNGTAYSATLVFDAESRSFVISERTLGRNLAVHLFPLLGGTYDALNGTWTGEIHEGDPGGREVTELTVQWIPLVDLMDADVLATIVEGSDGESWIEWTGVFEGTGLFDDTAQWFEHMQMHSPTPMTWVMQDHGYGYRGEAWSIEPVYRVTDQLIGTAGILIPTSGATALHASIRLDCTLPAAIYLSVGTVPYVGIDLFQHTETCPADMGFSDWYEGPFENPSIPDTLWYSKYTAGGGVPWVNLGAVSLQFIQEETKSF